MPDSNPYEPPNYPKNWGIDPLNIMQVVEIENVSKNTSIKKKQFSGKKLNMKQFLQIKHNDISHLLSEDLRKSLGAIDDAFDVFIYGNSGDGKTTFSNQIVKELSPLGKVLHLLYEEGHSKSVRQAVERTGISQINGYDLMDNCSYEDLEYILSRKKGPRIVIIDSFQYARFTKQQWFALKDKYVKGRRKKIFIIISHADGKKPRGSVATDAMYDAQIKVFVRGKIAFVKSRYEGSQNYVIWEQGAKDYWGRKYKHMLKKQIF